MNECDWSKYYDKRWRAAKCAFQASSLFHYPYAYSYTESSGGKNEINKPK